ncbi:MAG: helix-turn-helix domain-containing protein [Cyclobacteriaceae bacterium]
MKQSILLNVNLNELKDLIKECLNEWQPETKGESKDEILSQGEASKFLGISQPTIIDWKKRGLIPFHQVPNTRRVFYLKSELLQKSQSTQKS